MKNAKHLSKLANYDEVELTEFSGLTTFQDKVIWDEFDFKTSQSFSLLLRYSINSIIQYSNCDTSTAALKSMYVIFLGSMCRAEEGEGQNNLCTSIFWRVLT